MVLNFKMGSSMNHGHKHHLGNELPRKTHSYIFLDSAVLSSSV